MYPVRHVGSTLNWHPMLPLGQKYCTTTAAGMPRRHVVCFHLKQSLQTFSTNRVGEGAADGKLEEGPVLGRIKLDGVSSYLCSICKNGIQYLKIYESMNLVCYLLVCVSVCTCVCATVCMAT